MATAQCGAAPGKTATGQRYRTCCHQCGRHHGQNDVEHTPQCLQRQAAVSLGDFTFWVQKAAQLWEFCWMNDG